MPEHYYIASKVPDAIKNESSLPKLKMFNNAEMLMRKQKMYANKRRLESKEGKYDESMKSLTAVNEYCDSVTFESTIIPSKKDKINQELSSLIQTLQSHNYNTFDSK